MFDWRGQMVRTHDVKPGPLERSEVHIIAWAPCGVRMFDI